MILSLILLSVIVGVGAVLYLIDRRKPGERKAESEQKGVCCGMHANCEKRYASPPDTIVYYDDEELDALADRDPSSYTPEETEALRDVILTLRPEDALGWERSLELRHIALPPELRDELIILINN